MITAAATAAAVSLLPPPQSHRRPAVSLLPPPQSRRRPGTIQLCTKPTFSPLLRLSPTPLLSTARSVVASSLKEKIGGIKKSWVDFTSLYHHVDRDYSYYYRLVDSVNTFEPHFQKLSDEQLRAKTEEFRHRLKQGASLSDLQAEAFAVVREAAKRKLGMRHYDVQIVGGAVLQDGSIAEIKSGEGKTLVSTLAAYLNALSGEGVHVVTVNDYLARRDAELMGRVHRFLGLSVGLIQSGMTGMERRFNYTCDITYTTHMELCFDYLRDNLAGRGELVMRWPRPLHFGIVDEVDSILIDEGIYNLKLSEKTNEDETRFLVAARIADSLVQGLHYNVDVKKNSVELSEDGILLAQEALGTSDLWDENDPWARFVLNALIAKHLCWRDVHYMVQDGKALMIDNLTHRVEDNFRWTNDFHQAVEAKEQAGSAVVAQFTYQSFFKLYPKLSGMIGTAKTEEKEFFKFFEMPVIEIPMNIRSVREDLPPMLCATAGAKWKYVCTEIKNMFELGRPVLVGSTSVKDSEHLSAMLREIKIPHKILNALPKYAAREAEIVAQAGRKNAVTLLTNMAGRGTDIILGGNPEILAKNIAEDKLLSILTDNLPDVEVDRTQALGEVLSEVKVGPSSFCLLDEATLMYKNIRKREGRRWTYDEASKLIAESIEMSRSVGWIELQKLVYEQAEMYPLGPCIALAYLSVLEDCESHCFHEGLEVKRLGGLHVIGTSLHEFRRIDSELRGRSGRRGDPGSTRLMVSLQDKIIQNFDIDMESVLKVMSRLIDIERVAVDNPFVTKQISNFQVDSEKYFFKIRKKLIEFDDVFEVQRKHVYDLRQSILFGDYSQQHIFKYMQEVASGIVCKNVDPTKHPSSWKLGTILEEFIGISENTLNGITEENMLHSLEQVRRSSSMGIDEFHLPSLPKPPGSLISSSELWQTIRSDDSIKDGKFRSSVKLLCKYLGDFLITAYLDVIRRSGYSSAYVKAIERVRLLESIDKSWSDHLVKMNRLHEEKLRSIWKGNALEEFKVSGSRFFISMLNDTKMAAVQSILQHLTSPTAVESEKYLSKTKISNYFLF